MAVKVKEMLFYFVGHASLLDIFSTLKMLLGSCIL